MPDIFDVAIGTIFVFLLFSLVVSAFNEFILSLFDNRAKFLQLGLNELLGTATSAAQQPSGFGAKLLNPFIALWRAFFVRSQPSEWTRALCGHGLINAFSRSNGSNAPSYIPTGAFVTALLDLIARQQLTVNPAQNQAAADLPPINIATVIAGIRALPAGKLKESLLSLLSSTGSDLTAFKTALEGWFNASMDRVTGWYKRFAQKWTILLGFLIAALLNVDSIHIIQVLSSNPNLAKAVASQAQAYASTDKPGTTEDKRKEREAKVAAAKKEIAEAQTAGDKAKESAAQKKLEEVGEPASMETARTEFQNSVSKLSGAGIPIGWNVEQLKALNLEGKTITATTVWNKRAQLFPWFSQHRGQLVMLVAGWVLTALAGSLGAAFWFDLLGRFVNIRNNGKAPADKDPTQGEAVALPALNHAPPNPDPLVAPAPHLAAAPLLP